MCWGDVMSKIFGKLISGLIILAVIAAAISAFRNSMLPGSAGYDAFTAVFDCFPFANEMAIIAAHIGQFGTTLQGLTPSNILIDITKIYGMAITCPIIIGLANVIFLPVPDYEDWYDLEQFMKKPGYRIKSLALNVLLMPVCAFATTWALDTFQAFLQQKMPWAGSAAISFGILTLVFIVSVMVGGTSNPISMGMLFMHRLVSDLLGGALKILGLNLLCFLIALAILNGQAGVAMGGVVTMFVYLVLIELVIRGIIGKIGEF